MRISELIQEPEETQEIYGDLPVVTKDDDGHFEEIYDAQAVSRMYDRYLELKQ